MAFSLGKESSYITYSSWYF